MTDSRSDFPDFALDGDARPGEDGPIEVIRSEERLDVTRRTVPVERVRIRKVIVEEERTITVRLRREELVVDREPLDGAGRGDIALTEPGRSHTFVLQAEEPVITTRVVPVERVHVIKDVVTQMQIVTEDVRKERVDVIRTTDPR